MKFFIYLAFVGGILFSNSNFAVCPFTTSTDIPGYWQGMNSQGVATGEVVFRVENINADEFQGIAHVSTGKCRFGLCDLLPHIVGGDFQVSGTCKDDQSLDSVTFNNQTVDWVLGKSFGGTLPLGIVFQTTMGY